MASKKVKFKETEIKRVEVACHGCSRDCSRLLNESVNVVIKITITKSRSGDGWIWTDPDNCPHNYGGHRDWCSASHPGERREGDDRIMCKFSFDYPYILENIPDWQPPAELKEIMKHFLKS